MREQEVHHELDDFTRGEVIARLFVGLLVKAAHQVLKQIAHGNVGNGVGVQVYGSDLLDHIKQAVGFFKFFDLFFKLELLNDLASAGGESRHVVRQVGCQLVRVAQQALKSEFAGVEERQLELVEDHFFDGLGVVLGLAVFVGLLFELLVVLDDGIFTGFQHAVQTAQHRERNHDPAVLRWAVGTAQQVGDVPDDVAVGLEGVDIFHEALRD